MKVVPYLYMDIHSSLKNREWNQLLDFLGDRGYKEVLIYYGWYTPDHDIPVSELYMDE